MSEFRIDVLGRKAPRPRKLKPEVSDRVAAAQGKRSLLRFALTLLWWVVKPRRTTWVLGALAFVLIAYGTPHVLVTYTCTGIGTPGLRCYECRYLGVQGMRDHMGQSWNCPVIAMLPVNWSAVARQVGL